MPSCAYYHSDTDRLAGQATADRPGDGERFAGPPSHRPAAADEKIDITIADDGAASAPAPSPATPKYERRGTLGKGAFGVVYRVVGEDGKELAS